jgi:hypothetical protein
VKLTVPDLSLCNLHRNKRRLLNQLQKRRAMTEVDDLSVQ